MQHSKHYFIEYNSEGEYVTRMVGETTPLILAAQEESVAYVRQQNPESHLRCRTSPQRKANCGDEWSRKVEIVV